MAGRRRCHKTGFGIAPFPESGWRQAGGGAERPGEKSANYMRSIRLSRKSGSNCYAGCA
jgi:hypothetical protein